MAPPVFTDITRYQHSTLEPIFAERIAASSGVGEVGVRILSSHLADVDNDGVRDDVYGTAILQVGSRFKSFIFLYREDGASRFLENTGQAFNPTEGLRTLSCMESRAWLCPATLDRAESASYHGSRWLRGAAIMMGEVLPDAPGAELIIERGGGRFRALNSLALFAGSES